MRGTFNSRNYALNSAVSCVVAYLCTAAPPLLFYVVALPAVLKAQRAWLRGMVAENPGEAHAPPRPDNAPGRTNAPSDTAGNDGMQPCFTCLASSHFTRCYAVCEESYRLDKPKRL